MTTQVPRIERMASGEGAILKLWGGWVLVLGRLVTYRFLVSWSKGGSLQIAIGGRRLIITRAASASRAL